MFLPNVVSLKKVGELLPPYTDKVMQGNNSEEKRLMRWLTYLFHLDLLKSYQFMSFF